MAAKKYYWLVWSYNNAGNGKTLEERVTNLHPFEFMRNHRGEMGRLVTYNIALINWKEITKKEFDNF